MAFLYQIRPDGTPVGYWEIGPKPLVVGRGDIADAFVDDDALSWGHFLIVGEGDGFFLIDLNSSNGTWLNAARVSAHRMGPSEFIFAGESIFCFSTTPVSSFVMPDTAVLTRGSAAARAGG